jgi:hypothetical protein
LHLEILRCAQDDERSTKEFLVPSFPGVDYMDIDSLFSEDELMVRQTVRDFVDDEVLPIIEHANREEKFPGREKKDSGRIAAPPDQGCC